jgi:hypothetical protein
VDAEPDDVAGHAPPNPIADHREPAGPEVAMQQPVVTGVLRVRVVLADAGQAQERRSGLGVRQQHVARLAVHGIRCGDRRWRGSTGSRVDESDAGRPEVVVVVGHPDVGGQDGQGEVADSDVGHEAKVHGQVRCVEEQPPTAAVDGGIVLPLLEFGLDLGTADRVRNQNRRRLRGVVLLRRRGRLLPVGQQTPVARQTLSRRRRHAG